MPMSERVSSSSRSLYILSSPRDWEKKNLLTLIKTVQQHYQYKPIDICIKSKKEHQENTIILFFGSFEDKVSTVIAASTDLADKFPANNLIKEVVEKIGGKGGGGKPDLAMGGGNNKSGIQDAIKKLKEVIQ